MPKAGGGTWRSSISTSLPWTPTSSVHPSRWRPMVRPGMPFKEGSVSPSGSGRLYFHIFFHLPSGIALRFWPRGRGLAIKLFLWVKHYTASVYWGHGNLSWPTPFLWDQPARLTDGWLFKPYIGRVSQTSKTKVIGSLHTPRMRGKRREVIIWLLRWPFGISLDARVGSAYPSKRRIERWLSISEDLLARQAHALLGLRLLGHPVSFENWFHRPVVYPTHSVPTTHTVVSMPRLPFDPGETGYRDLGFHYLMEISCKSLQGIPLGTLQIDAYLFTDSKCCVLWYTHGQTDHLR